MAERPQNHITGDSAITDIKAKLLPRSWVVNDQIKDYGLDLQVEVCIDNRTTGKFFFIQSKGTEEVSNNGEISYNFPVDRLLDYKAVPIPVLIVYYSITEDIFWGIWANKLYDRLTEKQKKQDTYAIRYQRHNIINKDVLESIGPTIKLDVVTRIDFRTDHTDANSLRLHKQSYRLLDKLYPNCFSYGNDLAAQSLLIEYQWHDSELAISVSKDIHIPSGRIDQAFLWYPDVEINDAPLCIQALMAAIGMICVNKKSLAYPYDIFTNEVIDVLLPIVPENLWLDWAYYLPLGKINKLNHFHNVSVVSNYNAVAQFILIASFFRSEPEVKVFQERFQRLMLSYETNPENKAKLCYNIANQVRNQNAHEAGLLYVQAAKCFPEYKNMSYWWKELAGVLFITKHYYLSQRFYEKALSLTEDNDDKMTITLLLADTFLYQGNIKQGHATIQKCFDISVEENKAVPEHVLLLARVYGMHVNEFESEGYIPKNGNEWYDEGLTNQNENDYDRALRCFLISWSYNIYDKDALMAALVMSINARDVLCLTLIVGAIRTLFDTNEIKALIRNIVNWSLPQWTMEILLKALIHWDKELTDK